MATVSKPRFQIDASAAVETWQIEALVFVHTILAVRRHHPTLTTTVVFKLITLHAFYQQQIVLVCASSKSSYENKTNTTQAVLLILMDFVNYLVNYYHKFVQHTTTN